MPRAVLVDVVDRVGHRLDFAGPPVAGPARVVRALIVDPVVVNGRVGRAGEVIAERGGPTRSSALRVGRGRSYEGDAVGADVAASTSGGDQCGERRARERSAR